MQFYLDDCADANALVVDLTDAGHLVETPRSAGLGGARDPKHLDYAAQHGLTLITKNPADFLLLHEEFQQQGRLHAGILLVYQDNVPSKDMRSGDIVRAIERLRSSGLKIEGEVHILNHWR
jgi:predicted nuclease of predicted toxin-antitoxin system